MMEVENGNSLVDKIIDEMNNLHKNGMRQHKHNKSTFPEEFHPRRKQLYRPFTPNNDTFFKLRSNGVPVLTAYFLSEASNITRIHRQITEKECIEREDALSLLKNI
jgi:hypothetical protein